MGEGEALELRSTVAGPGPLQPDEEVHARILARIEPVAPSVHVEQLERDRATLVALQLESFAGDGWEATRQRLWLYAYRTLPAKVVSGGVFRLGRAAGVPAAVDLQAPATPVVYDEAVDLVVDVIALALPSFKERLMAGKWDPYREDVACLDTYWFGWCVLKFPAPWRKRNRRVRRHRLEAAAAVVDADRGHVEGPERLAVQRSEVVRALRTLPENVRAVVALDALGFTGREVADELGMTAKTVEGRLRKARGLLASLRETGDGAA